MMKSIVFTALLLGAPVIAGAGTSAAPAAVDSGAAAQFRVDVNRATAAELERVPGIGERLAQAIIDLREKRGSFAKLEDLLEVRGIGEKNLALLADHLTVAKMQPPPAGVGIASPSK
jgi:competence protein ComEA